MLRLEGLTASRDMIARRSALRITARRSLSARLWSLPAQAIELRLVTLPLFPAMTDADQDDVLHALHKSSPTAADDPPRVMTDAR